MRYDFAAFKEACKVEHRIDVDSNEEHWTATIELDGCEYEAGSFISEEDAIFRLWDRVPDECVIRAEEVL